MKRIILILLISIFSSTLFAQKGNNEIESAIVGFFNGLSLINADTIMYYTTPDFHLLEDGEVWNMDTLLNKVLPMKDAGIKRINRFEFLRIEQTGNTAWISYHNTAQFTLGEKRRDVRWLESAVLVRIKGRWKIQMLHSTVVK